VWLLPLPVVHPLTEQLMLWGWRLPFLVRKTFPNAACFAHDSNDSNALPHIVQLQP
jgi:hypothetical protein